MSRRRRPAPVDGLALVDKDVGWTSHDVVARARKVLGTSRVGHAGTLDPPATGLLLVGIGRMTRLLRFLTALPKTYVGEVVLGTETTTLDDTGEVTAIHEMGAVGLADVRAAAETLTGPILQIPPMVSALKVDGTRLHELARAGQEVERAPRPVTIHAFTVDEPVAPGVFPIAVTCSSGTYVRSLAADLGSALGGGAHLRNLRRISSGSLHVDDAVPVDALTVDSVLSPSDALRDLWSVVVTADLADDVEHGRPLERSTLGIEGDASGPFALLDDGRRLLAVYEPFRPGWVKPSVVLASG